MAIIEDENLLMVAILVLGVSVTLSAKFFSRKCLSLFVVAFSLQSFSLAQGQEESESSEPEQPKKSAPQAARASSVFLPDWAPSSFGIELNPVLGFEYLTLSRTKESRAQAEIGGFIGLRGIPVIPGNPGFQIEPGAGYAVGQAIVKADGKSAETGAYTRRWGSVGLPIYYRFIRQTFLGRYGVVSGSPLPLTERLSLQSDTAVALIPHVSAHYTLTYANSTSDSVTKPEFSSYDHWLHARLTGSILNFFVDVGPGFSTSKSSQKLGSTGSLDAKSSGAYLLGLSGFDLLTDKIGFEASAKYMFTSETDVNFYLPEERSPLDDLGAIPALTGLPADSLHASAFFGIRRLIGAVGIGWRYSLEILNFSESNNTKQQKRETNGLGIYASVRF